MTKKSSASGAEMEGGRTLKSLELGLKLSGWDRLKFIDSVAAVGEFFMRVRLATVKKTRANTCSVGPNGYIYALCSIGASGAAVLQLLISSLGFSWLG